MWESGSLNYDANVISDGCVHELVALRNPANRAIMFAIHRVFAFHQLFILIAVEKLFESEIIKTVLNNLKI